MLRITVDHGAHRIALQLEAKLAGDWVRELRTVWVAARRKGTVVVSLTSVSSVERGRLSPSHRDPFRGRNSDRVRTPRPKRDSSDRGRSLVTWTPGRNQFQGGTWECSTDSFGL
jgi:hypothetical protein